MRLLSYIRDQMDNISFVVRSCSVCLLLSEFSLLHSQNVNLTDCSWPLDRPFQWCRDLGEAQGGQPRRDCRDQRRNW